MSGESMPADTFGAVSLEGVDADSAPAAATQASAEAGLTGPVSYTHLTLPTILLV